MTAATLGIVAVLFAWQTWRLRARQLAAWGVSSPRDGWRWACAVAAGLLLLVASLDPRGNGAGDAAMSPPGREVVLLIDLSRSMTAADAAPTRFGRATAAASELVQRLSVGGGNRVAVVAFAARPVLACPLTSDANHVRHALAALDIDHPPAAVRPTDGGSGTRFGAGLTAALAAFGTAAEARAVVLLSDGDDPARDGEWQAGVAAARAAGVPVDVVGLGDPERDAALTHDGKPLSFAGHPVVSRLNESLLRTVCRETGGVYLPARTGSVAWGGAWWSQAVAARPTRRLPAVGRTSASLAGPLVIAAAALGCVALLPRLPAAVALVPLALAAGDDALSAGDRLFAAGRYADAAARYDRALRDGDDPGPAAARLAACRFHQGDYTAAERHYRQALSDAVGDRRLRLRYDLATTTLHRSGGNNAAALKEAVAAFEALLVDLPTGHPQRADAVANGTLARDLLATIPREQPERDPGRPKPGDGTGHDPGTGPPPPEGGPGLPGDAGTPADGPQPAGKGNLPVVNDDGSPGDGRRWLAEAERRSQAAAAERRDRLKLPAQLRGPDW